MVVTIGLRAQGERERESLKSRTRKKQENDERNNRMDEDFNQVIEKKAQVSRAGSFLTGMLLFYRSWSSSKAKATGGWIED